jgi:hypothetical protein
MTEEFNPLQKLKEASHGQFDAPQCFKDVIKDYPRDKVYYRLDTFDFEEYIACIKAMQNLFLPDFSVNELGYLFYLYYWLEDKRKIAD